MRTHCAIDLHDAVGFDLREHVEARLREDPASVNKVLDHWGIPRCTPLHWAAWLTIEDVDGEHPHDPAAREELVTLLLEKGPIPTSWPATASRRSMLPAQPVPSESGRCWSGTAASARRTCNPR